VFTFRPPRMLFSLGPRRRLGQSFCSGEYTLHALLCFKSSSHLDHLVRRPFFFLFFNWIRFPPLVCANSPSMLKPAIVPPFRWPLSSRASGSHRSCSEPPSVKRISLEIHPFSLKFIFLVVQVLTESPLIAHAPGKAK